MATKQFMLYANITIDPDRVSALRKLAKKIGAELIAAGAWANEARAKVSDVDGTDHVRVMFEIDGPKLESTNAARTAWLRLVEKAIELGGSVWTAGFAHGSTDESLFDEHPELRANPNAEMVPEPISVQIAKAFEAENAAKLEATKARAEVAFMNETAAKTLATVKSLEAALVAERATIAELRTEIAALGVLVPSPPERAALDAIRRGE